MIVARYPLSSGQQGMWFAEQLSGATCAYHDHEFFRLTGRLDTAAFRAAVEHVADRHEVLRTRVVTLGGDPQQLVDDRWHGQVRVQPAPAMLPGAAQVDAFVRDVTRRPLDLEQGPLFLVDLLALGDEENLLAFTMHHLITDGWSLRLLLEQISQCYDDLLAGREPGWAPAVPYGEFARWQHDMLAGPDREPLRAYWTRHLAGAPTAVDFGGGGGGKAGDEPGTATVGFDIPGTDIDRLAEFARKYGATLFMALLAAFDVVVAQVAGARDVLVGVPVVGRTVPGFEEVPGFFVNLLPVRADLRDDPAAGPLLRRVRAAILDGFAHQDLPFGQIVAAVNPSRTPDAYPLVQATLQLIDATFDSALRLAGVDVVSVPADPLEIPYALSLDLYTTADGLRGRLVYTTAAVAPQTAARIAGRFARLVAVLPDDEQATVSVLMDLCALGARE
jgi:hypothetical protein